MGKQLTEEILESEMYANEEKWRTVVLWTYNCTFFCYNNYYYYCLKECAENVIFINTLTFLYPFPLVVTLPVEYRSIHCPIITMTVFEENHTSDIGLLFRFLLFIIIKIHLENNGVLCTTTGGTVMMFLADRWLIR